MTRFVRKLIHDKRGGSEIIALALIAALVIAFAFTYGKDMMTKVGTKYRDMGNCVKNPNNCP